MNIMQLIKDQMSGDTLDKLSEMIGESREGTTKAASAAVPSLLALLAKLATSAGGAQKLIDLLKNLDPSVFGNIGGGKASPPPPEVGEDFLGKLLQGGTLQALLAALSKYAGINMESAKKLLASVLPMILATIAAQFKNRPMTPQGLASFFEEQKPYIASALPPGFSLPELPGLDTMEAGMPKWLLPVVGVAALALIAWFLLGSPKPAAAPPAADGSTAETKSASPPAVQETSKIVPTVDPNALKKDLTDVYKSATETLESIKDPASATAALPKIEGLNTTLDNLKALWEKLPESDRSAIAKVTNENLPKVKELVAKVLAIPGVADKLKPALDSLVAKLSAFA
jgi:hypothetical protein